MTKTPLSDIITAQKQGRPRGITSICSANPAVLNAAFAHAKANKYPLLIESTCNQVNQYGGYTGQTPETFIAGLQRLVQRYQFDPEQLILGGDHLGPNPWRKERAAEAMEKAKVLVRDYVRAGYTKIHLDTSMSCADDAPGPLSGEIIARRSAELALIGEKTMREMEVPDGTLHYVIGTEVPAPGGVEHGEDDGLAVSSANAVDRTIRTTRQAFLDQGLEAAWNNVVAVVVQPGVEYGNDSLFPYDSDAAGHLSKYIDGVDGLVFEAHSTDYQTRDALEQLVKDHFAILKVGPALTFAYREAVFALSMIEEAWPACHEQSGISHVRTIIDEAMLANPAYWQAYYLGEQQQQRYARQYSLSDRVRYYWPVASVQKALEQLLANLAQSPIPLPLLSQFLPDQFRAVRDGRLLNEPNSLVEYGITAVLYTYAQACGF